MKTRRYIAFVTLAIAVIAPAMFAVVSVTGGLNLTPEWGYALGMNREEALVLGVGGAIMCSFLPGIGSAACGITGAL
jgi:hypothetical protein